MADAETDKATDQTVAALAEAAVNSPACDAGETGDAYEAYLDRDSLIAELNTLLEGERAGAQVAAHLVAETEQPGIKALARQIQSDDVRGCRILGLALRELGTTPSEAVGNFYEQAIGIADPAARLAFFHRGQAWVVLKLKILLPKVRCDGLHADLLWMLASHDLNVTLIEAALKGLAPSETQSPAASPLGRLIEGYRRFRTTQWPEERERFEITAEHGQQPHTLVIACSDSRVDPQMILGAHPGELFVVRNVANLVPPCESDEAHHGTSAAIEFAVRVLQVSRVLVLGHGMCGGVKMLLETESPGGLDFAGRWMDLARHAKLATEGIEPAAARHRACEEATVRLSLANLMTFSWVVEAVESGRLSLHGGYFDIRHGVLHILQADGGFAEATLDHNQVGAPFQPPSDQNDHDQAISA